MEFDYIIVGAGSAGCVLANRLNSNPDIRVCLLEAETKDTSPLIHTPVGGAAILPTRHVNWAFDTVAQPGINGRVDYQPRGKVLGGSSSINGMIYSQLRVHGIEGMRVIEASIMPPLVGGNTNAAAIMIAERGAEWVASA